MASSPNITPDESIDVESIRARLNTYKTDNGKSWSDLAKVIGVPAGTLSPFGTGTYAGDNVRVAADVARWFETETARALLASTVTITAPTFVQTIAAKRIFTLLTWAQQGNIVTVVAPPGFGKTSALRQYKATRSQVWLTTTKPTSSDVSSMLQTILDAMGEKDARGTPRQLSRRVCERVENSNGLIIIDEAQLSSEQAIEEARAIHDETGIGIAFVGNETLQARIEGGGKRKATPQLSSRVSMPLKDKSPHADDFELIARAWGIEDAAMIRWMRMLVKQPGALRAQRNVLKLASLMAHNDGTNVTLAHLREAWAELSNLPLAA